MPKEDQYTSIIQKLWRLNVGLELAELDRNEEEYHSEKYRELLQVEIDLLKQQFTVLDELKGLAAKNRKFICVKSLSLQMFDDNGESIEGASIVIDAGTVWNDTDDVYKMIAGSDAYRLKEKVENNTGRWIEIYGDRLEEYFEEVKPCGDH